MSAAASVADAGHDLAAIVDLENYPIHRHGESARERVVARAREQLETDGCALLKGFVTAQALRAMTEETVRLAPEAHYNHTHTNPYNSDGDPALPAGHPKNTFGDRSNGFVAGDRIGNDTLIRRLYHHPDFQRFVAAAMNEPELHEYADPLGGLVVNVLRDGCQHPWHYDTNEFIVTLMTRQPEAGGEFEYCPRIRNPRAENFDAVQRVLEGDRDPVRTLALQPGDLQIFYGRYALHRVAQVRGARERHTVIFSYAREAGFVGRAERARRIFGRTAPIHDRQSEEGPTRHDNLAD